MDEGSGDGRHVESVFYQRVIVTRGAQAGCELIENYISLWLLTDPAVSRRRLGSTQKTQS